MTLTEFLETQHLQVPDAVISEIDRRFVILDKEQELSEQEIDESVFFTNNTFVAAVLRCLGFPISNIETNGRSVRFLFSGKSKILPFLIAYENGRLQMDPKQIVCEFDSLKNLVRGVV